MLAQIFCSALPFDYTFSAISYVFFFEKQNITSFSRKKLPTISRVLLNTLILESKEYAPGFHPSHVLWPDWVVVCGFSRPGLPSSPPPIIIAGPHDYINC